MGPRKSGGADRNQVTFLGYIKEFDNLGVKHFNTATAESFANAIFVVGAMYVNVAIVTVATIPAVVSGFQATQTDNACGNQIASLFFFRKFGKKPTGWDSSFEHHAERRCITYFIR